MEEHESKIIGEKRRSDDIDLDERCGFSRKRLHLHSSSDSGIPKPSKRGGDTNNDLTKTKIAASTGLLNNLNPAIIRHVRNKKQFLTMFQNLINSYKHSQSSHGTQMKNSDNTSSKPGFSEDRCGNAKSNSFTHKIKPEDDSLSRKLSSSLKDESADFTSKRVQTVKAATVASQWLGLLHKDTKSRLSALRRSKKRVEGVITTELPFIVQKEFFSGQENHPNAMPDGFSRTENAEMHKARWTTLFDHLYRFISDEERQLERMLTQVKGMWKLCDQGLKHIKLLKLGVQGSDLRATERVVRAAAASIYSTCNFSLSKETINVPET